MIEYRLLDFRIQSEKRAGKRGATVTSDKSPSDSRGISQIQWCFEFKGSLQRFGAMLGFEQSLERDRRADFEIVPFFVDAVQDKGLQVHYRNGIRCGARKERPTAEGDGVRLG